MKRNQLPNIYGENVILPPPLEGEDEKVPVSSKVPDVKPVDLEEYARNHVIYPRDRKLLEQMLEVKKREQEKHRHKRDIADITRKIEEYEEEMRPQRKTEVPPPPQEEDIEAISKGPTLLLSSRLFDYFEKYSSPPHTKSPIRPPRSEEDEEVSIPSLTKLPIFEEPSEEEMKDWEDFISLKKRKKERMEGYLGEEDKSPPDEATTPPPKKKAVLDSDDLLKKCSKYYDLCRKL